MCLMRCSGAESSVSMFGKQTDWFLLDVQYLVKGDFELETAASSD